MCYVPGCQTDVFISYAHADNQDGWVTRLRDRLTQKLNPFLANRVRVWFDDRIRPGTYFKDDIQGTLRNTPIFVSVVSPSYLDSYFCMVDELEWFQKQGGKDVIQLLKVPVDEQDIPARAIHYERLHDKKGCPLPDGDLLDLALDPAVQATYNKLRQHWDGHSKIYMGQIRNPDLKERWDQLRKLLHKEGFAVLPRNVLTAFTTDADIRKVIDSAILSVHLEKVPDDPLAGRQLAIARRSSRPLLTLASTPSDDEFLARVRETMSAAPEQWLYVIYDHHSDREPATALIEQIKNSGLPAKVRVQEAGESYHKFWLQNSRAIVLFCRDAPEEWLKAQEEARRKFAGLGPVPFARYLVQRTDGSPEGLWVETGSLRDWTIRRAGEPDICDLRQFFDSLYPKAQAVGGQGS